MVDENERSGDLVQGDERTVDISELIPLGKQLIESHHQQAQEQTRIEREKIDLEKEKLGIQKWAFRHKFWLLAFITVSILSISAGLMFLRGNVQDGISILSHVGAVVVGIIAGSGWERVRGN